ncbi:class II fumarate hydratase [Notoacmeibacter sp. MSK16QG-6]|uniref:class II fumarate hydratase n=1 Tax=Notoacmeibacter sp. MSK16QG-6 TaxID=2957982 RepID=UPI00209E79E4|nr:class II fumarate hydratase [Notoacmeibacter sp. MSK16QG-6]MCP1200031.1 class II fumarate hydratase [Notoacmeibacter sp. MSK16QG-6]
MSEHPKMNDLPIGIDADGVREEFDSLGKVEVPADRYWGAQTQRSLHHFSIGRDRMAPEVHHAYGVVKKACAIVNRKAGRLPDWKAEAIVRAADEVIGGELDGHFPLFVWQTGSGTQTNMNVNEVIANRAIQLFGSELGSQKPVGPNDDVNMGQSSNDTFPTAMHIAAKIAIDDDLLPALRDLAGIIEAKADGWMNVVKTGRTHLQDAVPVTVGQEWHGWAGQLRDAIDTVEETSDKLLELALGGTAVGTGLNAPEGFSADTADEIAELTGKPFITAPNKFSAQGGLDAMVKASGGLRAVAVALMKIADDVRWLASGPRLGLGELQIPPNEPGSSIMPGKVNPTQSEALMMIAIQVMANDQAVAMGGSRGNLQLNVMRPVVIDNVLRSIRILTDGSINFRRFCIEGTELNRKRIDGDVERSLMLVTALAPEIGYNAAADIAKDAAKTGDTLRQAALRSGNVTEEDYDRIIRPETMTGDGLGGA